MQKTNRNCSLFISEDGGSEELLIVLKGEIDHHSAVWVRTEIDEKIEAAAGGAGTDRGTGGMRAKLTAAKLALEAGVPMVIANGANPDILYDICAGKQIGTLFKAPENK